MRSATSRWNISTIMSYQGGQGSALSQPIRSCGRDVVGQVGDDLGSFATEQRPRVEGQARRLHDLEPAGIARGNFLQGGDRALVMLDGDDALRAEREQRARQPARAGTDLNDGGVLERPGGTRDARGEIEVEQEVLAQRFACRQCVLANDLAKRREVVDRAHRLLRSPPCRARA